MAVVILEALIAWFFIGLVVAIVLCPSVKKHNSDSSKEHPYPRKLPSS
jgi:hypothetical protein